MADLTSIELAHFWSRVETSTPFQCWPWSGRKNESGYGRFREAMAHRIAYELINGSIPDGMIIRHRCDNPSCCNPQHLEPRTSADNTNDAKERNRLATGERHGKSRLTDEQVAYIRTNPDGLKQRALAERFGVSASTISYIRSGRSWRVVGARGFEPLASCVSSKRSTPELSPLTGTPEPDSTSTNGPDSTESGVGELRCQRRSHQ